MLKRQDVIERLSVSDVEPRCWNAWYHTGKWKQIRNFNIAELRVVIKVVEVTLVNIKPLQWISSRVNHHVKDAIDQGSQVAVEGQVVAVMEGQMLPLR
jgi:hypothetical protein